MKYVRKNRDDGIFVDAGDVAGSGWLHTRVRQIHAF
jgi:hypothetical protein